jgi:CRP-like cAMP-binding protein
MSSHFDDYHLDGQTAGEPSPADGLGANRLLGALPEPELARLEQYFSPVVFEECQVLLEPGQPMDRIYFPASGLISLSLDGGTDGSLRGTAGISIVGRDGMIGTVSALGTNPTFSRAKVEISGNGFEVPAQVLREELQRGGELQNLMMRHLQQQIVQTSQTPLCLRTHPREQRLSYWLLLIEDEIQQPTIRLSLSFFAHLLRVNYTDTILAAALLWQRGLIRFCHEYVTILNRDGLADCACPCYAVMRQEKQQFDSANQMLNRNEP